jgi:hypothetical protein
MMWILMCFIAVVVGCILYGKIEDQLPEPLRLPKTGTNGALVGDAPNQQNTTGASVQVASSQWQVRGDGRNVELVRDFDGRIEFNGERYDTPTLILTCYDQQLYVRADLKMAVALRKDKATVQTAEGTQQWSAGQAHDLYSPTPRALAVAVRAGKPFKMTFPYAELGNQTVTFTPKDGAKALEALPAACR